MNQNNKTNETYERRAHAHSKMKNTCRSATHSMCQQRLENRWRPHAMHSHLLWKRGATSHPTPAVYYIHTIRYTLYPIPIYAFCSPCSCALCMVLSILLLFLLLFTIQTTTSMTMTMHTNALWEFFFLSNLDFELRSPLIGAACRMEIYIVIVQQIDDRTFFFFLSFVFFFRSTFLFSGLFSVNPLSISLSLSDHFHRKFLDINVVLIAL